MNVLFRNVVLSSKAALLMALMLGMLFVVPAQAKSQCSGLSNSKCASNSTCTWRKASVDKNGKKTKAHCRALPGKAKLKKTTTPVKKTTSSSATNLDAAKKKAKKKKVKAKVKKKDQS